MRDYSYNFLSYGLEPYSEIRGKAPSFNGNTPADISVTQWFTARSSDGKIAKVKGLRGAIFELTKAKLKAIRPLVHVLDEALAKPDEVYLFKGKTLYYYTYFKFFSDRAVMVDVGFNIDRPFRLDRVAILKPDLVDVKRKGTLYYNHKTHESKFRPIQFQ